jgi:hypothetical protein
MGKTRRRLTGHTTEEPRVEAIGEQRAETALERASRGRHERSADDLLEQRREVEIARRFPVIAAREQPKREQPERPDVRCRRQRGGAVHLLGCHPKRRAHDHRAKPRGGLRELGDAKVNQLDDEGKPHDLRAAEQDVVGLDVAVHESDVVRRAEPVAELGKHAAGLVPRSRAPLGVALLEGLAFEQLHRDPWVPRLRIDTRAHGLNDVRAPHVRGEPGFLFEPLANGGVRHVLLVQHLERAALTGADLVDRVDGAHPPLRQ